MAAKVRSRTHNKSTESPRAEERGWIHHPAIDVIVGCGAWSAPLLLLSYPFGSANRLIVSFAFYGLALVFNYPHFMATIHRAYGARRDFSKYKVFTLHVTVLLVLTLIVSHWVYWIVPLLFTVYVTWSPWHYTGQNFGLAMMFARRNGVSPSRGARNAFHTAFLLSFVLIFLSFHTGPSNDPYVLSLGLPESLRSMLTVPLVVAFVSLGGWSLLMMARQKGRRAIVGPLVLFTTQSLWFVVPVVAQVVGTMQIPQTRYSTGVLAVMHSAQYLWITSYFCRRDAEAAGKTWKPVGYFATLLIGGIALFIPGPWLVSYVFRLDFAASFLIFTAVVNIHHFILDGAIWKLRDGRISSVLISRQEKAGQSLQSPHSRPAAFLRYVKVPAIAFLVLLAGLDLTKFYLGFDGEITARLARAESLNPYDQALLVKVARAQARAGDLDRTIATLERAISLNAHNSEPQNQLAKLLVDNQLFEQAYWHYQQMIVHRPRDVNALINSGVIASQLGREDEAIATWERALTIDPYQHHVHLYLAQLYETQNQSQNAIPHFENYLRALGSQTGEPRIDLKEVLSITLRLAQIYGRNNQFDRALIYSEKAFELSTQGGDKAISGLSLSFMGNAYAGLSRNSEAIKCYQRGLSFDAQSGDVQQEGMDWFNYAQFLRRLNQSNRLVLACLLKSEKLLEAGRGEGFEKASAARKQLETAVGSEVTRVRQDLESELNRALTLELQDDRS